MQRTRRSLDEGAGAAGRNGSAFQRGAAELRFAVAAAKLVRDRYDAGVRVVVEFFLFLAFFTDPIGIDRAHGDVDVGVEAGDVPIRAFIALVDLDLRSRLVQHEEHAACGKTHVHGFLPHRRLIGVGHALDLCGAGQLVAGKRDPVIDVEPIAAVADGEFHRAHGLGIHVDQQRISLGVRRRKIAAGKADFVPGDIIALEARLDREILGNAGGNAEDQAPLRTGGNRRAVLRGILVVELHLGDGIAVIRLYDEAEFVLYGKIETGARNVVVVELQADASVRHGRGSHLVGLRLELHLDAHIRVHGERSRAARLLCLGQRLSNAVDLDRVDLIAGIRCEFDRDRIALVHGDRRCHGRPVDPDRAFAGLRNGNAVLRHRLDKDDVDCQSLSNRNAVLKQGGIRHGLLGAVVLDRGDRVLGRGGDLDVQRAALVLGGGVLRNAVQQHFAAAGLLDGDRVLRELLEDHIDLHVLRHGNAAGPELRIRNGLLLALDRDGADHPVFRRAYFQRHALFLVHIQTVSLDPVELYDALAGLCDVDRVRSLRPDREGAAGNQRQQQDRGHGQRQKPMR